MTKRVWHYLGLLVVLGAVLIGVLAAAAAARTDSGAPGLAQAIAAQDRHTTELMSLSGVVGTAATIQNGEGAVLVLAARSGVTGIPSTLDGVNVVVDVTGPLTTLIAKAARPDAKPDAGGRIDPTARFARPVPIGVSTGNAGECSAGTISARVKSGTSVYALSNNHVYALENNAPIGSNVLQPGRYDTGCATDPANVIGTLSKYVPISFSGNNTVDAAIAATTTSQVGNSTPADGYGTPTSATTTASVNLAVKKYGRTTGLTSGTITAVNATVDVGYTAGTAHFVNQIIVESNKPFIKAGDSGSLLVTSSGNHPVGLLFAGTQSGKLAVGNNIGAVLSALGISIDGS
jgi:hypothetical protein